MLVNNNLLEESFTIYMFPPKKGLCSVVKSRGTTIRLLGLKTQFTSS